MNTKEYQDLAKSLRNNPMVEAWIEHARSKPHRNFKDCTHCGFPHDEHLICSQASFGEIVFGGHTYSISMSNVVWWMGFIESYAPIGAFHWKNERFFRRVPGAVEVTFFLPYNNTPQKNRWIIPSGEWDSIVAATMGKASNQQDDHEDSTVAAYKLYERWTK